MLKILETRGLSPLSIPNLKAQQLIQSNDVITTLIQLWQLTEKQLQERKTTAVTPFDTLYKPWPASQRLKVACNYAQEIKRQLALVTKPLNFNHSRTR